MKYENEKIRNEMMSKWILMDWFKLLLEVNSVHYAISKNSNSLVTVCIDYRLMVKSGNFNVKYKFQIDENTQKSIITNGISSYRT